MSTLARERVASALELVEGLADNRTADPFPLDVLQRLGGLLRADAAAGYVETSFGGAWRCASCGHLASTNGSCPHDGTVLRPTWYELVNRPIPPWLPDALETCGDEDPTHHVHCHTLTYPVAISDFLSARAFARLAVYHEICRPLGAADSLRLYLPAPGGSARFFFFDRSTRGFELETRELLELLRPHLARARQRWNGLPEAPALPLTPRQLEVLRWVSRGLTNEEIAARLWISEHTVRKHLENISDRLGVRTRVAAAVAYVTTESATSAFRALDPDVTAPDQGT
jgi:DNA-binding CsgD family transcriptional regulator